MNKILALLITLLVTLNVFSQDNYLKLPQAKTQNPTYIFNKNSIGNESLLKNIGKTKQEISDTIEEISVLKDKPNRENSDYFNLTEYGIVLVALKDDIICKTQEELIEFFKLPKQTDLYIDGYLLENKNYKIALTAIKEIEIVEPNTENGLKSSVLNIWTLVKNERYSDKVN